MFVNNVKKKITKRTKKSVIMETYINFLIIHELKL